MEAVFECMPIFAGIFAAQLALCRRGNYRGYTLFFITGISSATIINLVSGESPALLPADISVTLLCGIFFWVLKTQFLKKIYGR